MADDKIKKRKISKRRLNLFWLPLFTLLIFLTGCGVSSQFTRTLPSDFTPAGLHAHYINIEPIEQKSFFCGPAALSLVLTYWGCRISQEDIAKEVYIPSIRGTLNFELIQFAQNKNFWVDNITNQDSIKEYLNKDIPVIALCKHTVFGYHYIVIKGFDDKNHFFVIASGVKKDCAIYYSEFAESWNVAKNWAIAVYPIDKLDRNLTAKEYLRLGFLFEKQKKFKEAIKNYELSLGIEKNKEVYFNLGNIYTETGDYDKAVENYQKALLLDSSFADCYNNLAYVYLIGNKDLAKAKAFAYEAVRLDGKNKSYHLETLAQVYVEEKNFPEVVFTLWEAIDSTKDNGLKSVLHQKLAEAYLKSGKQVEAKRHLEISESLLKKRNTGLSENK